jgi:hypothetical protein
MFFSTPHRGANMASTLAKILKLANTQRKYIGNLERGGETVNAMNDLFSQRSENLWLISFWESTQTTIIGVNFCLLLFVMN